MQNKDDFTSGLASSESEKKHCDLPFSWIIQSTL